MPAAVRGVRAAGARHTLKPDVKVAKVRVSAAYVLQGTPKPDGAVSRDHVSARQKVSTIAIESPVLGGAERVTSIITARRKRPMLTFSTPRAHE
jgi:hypothetical protein